MSNKPDRAVLLESADAPPKVKPSGMFEWLRPNLTLPETGCILAIWNAMQMLWQSPLLKPTTALYIIGVMFFILLVRNVAAITTVAIVVNVCLRIAYPISYWEDQHWAQWYSISSLSRRATISCSGRPWPECRWPLICLQGIYLAVYSSR